MIELYNTLTKQIEQFKPQDSKSVKLYTCGPTVYDEPHLGNWVSYIYWDILVRALIVDGYKVNRVMNITDVGHLTSDEDEGEDKLVKGARRENKTAWQIAEKYTLSFLQEMDQLNLVKPEYIAKATDYIPAQLELVRKLKEKGYTYQIDDGIYFDTSKLSDYGKLANLNTDRLMAGARVKQNHQKRNLSDFALWKFSPENAKRDMEWDTPEFLMEGRPLRKGFPGWHLECSAIAMSLLGETLDIHTGGIDHIPVHHTNEIAQSEAVTGKLFSKFWLHNNHLKVGGTKISKSLSNGFTLKDIKEKGFSVLDFKMFVLQSHFQTESNFTWGNLEGAHARLHHWRAVACLRWQINEETKTASQEVSAERLIKSLKSAINENLNTPKALQIIDGVFSEIDDRPLDSISSSHLREIVIFIDDLLGLKLESSTPDINNDQRYLIKQREEARQNKDWKTSDAIRDELAAAGIQINDTASGSMWLRS